jgi:hypothetical protein
METTIRTARKYGWQVKRLRTSRERPRPELLFTKVVPNTGASIRSTVTLTVRVFDDPIGGFTAMMCTNGRATGGKLATEAELYAYLTA